MPATGTAPSSVRYPSIFVWMSAAILCPRGGRVSALDDRCLGDTPRLPHGFPSRGCSAAVRPSAPTSPKPLVIGSDCASSYAALSAGGRSPASYSAVWTSSRAHVVHEELVRGEGVLGLRAEVEALHAHERAGDLAAGGRDRVDGDVDALRLRISDVPRSRDDERGLARVEGLLREVLRQVEVDRARRALLRRASSRTRVRRRRRSSAATRRTSRPRSARRPSCRTTSGTRRGGTGRRSLGRGPTTNGYFVPAAVPAAIMSSNVAGASVARSVLRISAMFSMA